MKAMLLVGLAACTDYAHVAIHNAPGTIDLATPLAHENGDPARFDPPSDPGSSTVAVFAIPYVTAGVGRYEARSPDATGEAGLQFRVERTHSASDLLDRSAWAITAGVAFAQWGRGIRTAAPGAFYGEVNYRFLAKMWPVDIGLGPALYVDNPSVGAQATLSIFVMMLRARYVANTGAELFAGLELPIPFFFGGSR